MSYKHDNTRSKFYLQIWTGNWTQSVICMNISGLYWLIWCLQRILEEEKIVPFRPMRLFCSSSFAQMKKLARRHQQQQEQQNSQRLGQGRGSVMEAKQGGKNLQTFSKCHFHMDTYCLSTAMQGIHKCVPLPVVAHRAAVSEWLWYVIPNSSQTHELLTEASTFL